MCWPIEYNVSHEFSNICRLSKEERRCFKPLTWRENNWICLRLIFLHSTLLNVGCQNKNNTIKSFKPKISWNNIYKFRSRLTKYKIYPLPPFTGANSLIFLYSQIVWNRKVAPWNIVLTLKQVVHIFTTIFWTIKYFLALKMWKSVDNINQLLFYHRWFAYKIFQSSCMGFS